MMENVPLGTDSEQREFNQLVSLFDAPAYVRRGRQVEAALATLLAIAQTKREEWLLMVRLRLGTLFAMAGEPSVLRAMVNGDDDFAKLLSLHAELQPKLRQPIAVTTSGRKLRSALRELIVSIERFNIRWREYLPTLDRSECNRLREGYNKYYVLEKACALKSDLLARRDFVPLPMLEVEELSHHLPLLPTIRAAQSLG